MITIRDEGNSNFFSNYDKVIIIFFFFHSRYLYDLHTQQRELKEMMYQDARAMVIRTYT